MRSGVMASHILKLGTMWRWVISFMLRLLYPKKRVPGIH